MTSTDASASLQWYLYQKLIAMYLACRFLIQNASLDDNELKKWYLSIEIDWDDVVICKWDFNVDDQDFNTREEIHLFQTKFYGADTMSEHHKAILQLYLNQEYRKKQHPTANIYSSFITKEKIKHSSIELWLEWIIELLNNTYKSKYLIPKNTDTQSNPPKYDRTDFPRDLYQDLMNNFPTFNESSFSISPIFWIMFQNLSIDNIKSFLQDNIPLLNPTITIWDAQIDNLYYKLTQRIFDGKYISLYEIKEIFSQNLTETLDNLISNWSNERKFQLKKDQFLRKIWDLFDIEDILGEIRSEITYNHDDIITLVSQRFDDLNKYIKLLEKKDFDDFLYKVTLKDITPIINQQSFIDFWSKNIPEDIVWKWLKTYLHCYMRCEQKSFDDIFLITWIDWANARKIIKDVLEMLYHKQSTIWIYKYNYHDDEPYIEFSKEELQRIWIISKEYVDQSQLITQPYKISICCMNHIRDCWLNNKFREQEECNHCKTKFNSLL